MMQLVHLLSALAAATGSDPYIRTRINPGTDTSIPAAERPCLWWGISNITYNQSDAGNPATGPTAFDAVNKALMNWKAVNDACGSLALSEGLRISDRKVGYDSTSPNNTNLILFRTRNCGSVVPPDDPCRTSGGCSNLYDCWSFGSAVIALTTSSYKVSSGRLLDTDVELNSATGNFVFTTVDSPPCLTPSTQSQSCIAYDIQNTMTHELGHSLGLDHTYYPGSTMNPTAGLGEISKRIIDPGSRQFVCDAYPQNLPPRDCHLLIAGDNNRLAGCGVSIGEPVGLGFLIAALRMASRRRRSRRSVA